MFTCPACQTSLPAFSYNSEMACGPIWAHEHDGCSFYSLSPNPTAKVERWNDLRSAWAAIRDQYADDDSWALGWDAYLRGNTARARRLWRKYEHEMSALHNESAFA